MYRDSLLSAIASDNIKKVKKMLEEFEKFENNAYIVNNRGSCYYPPCHCNLHVYPLEFACAISNLEVVKCLVEHGANINAINDDFSGTVLMSLLGFPYLQLTASGYSDYNLTALMFASARGHLGIVKYLVENGADINAKDKNGLTVLMYATLKGLAEGGNLEIEVAKYLVENGANIKAKFKNSVTAFIIALMFASAKGNLEVAKYLVELGANNINAKNKKCITALMFASVEGDLEAAEYLVENGADNWKSLIALMYATLKGLAKGGNLVENVTDISAKDKNGITATLIIALMFASAKGDLEVTKYLAELGADINAKDNNGETALMHASVKGHLEVAKYLAELGADINAKDKNGKTALIMSSENGKLEIVKYLEKKLELDNEVKTYLNQCLERIKEIKNMIKEFDYSDRKSYIDEILDIEDNINKEFVELNVDKTNEIIDRVNEIYKNAYKRKNNISSLSYIIDIIETEEQISLINNIDINDLE